VTQNVYQLVTQVTQKKKSALFTGVKTMTFFSRSIMFLELQNLCKMSEMGMDIVGFGRLTKM